MVLEDEISEHKTNFRTKGYFWLVQKKISF